MSEKSEHDLHTSKNGSHWSGGAHDNETANDMSANKKWEDVEEDVTCTSPANQIQDMSMTLEDKAPDGGWGWFIVLGGFLTHFLMGGFERSQGIIFLQLRKQFGQSATSTAWVTSINSTLRLFLGPIASALCNRFSVRTVVMLGSCLCFISVFSSAFTEGLIPLYFTYGFLGGLGRALTYTPSLIIVGQYFSKKRGVAVGLATSGVGVGTSIFPPLIEVMFEYYSYWGTFVILSAVVCNFCVCAALSRPLDLHRRIMKSDRLKRQGVVQKADSEMKSKLLTVPTSEATSQIQPLDDFSLQTTSTTDITANFKIESRQSSLLKRKYSHIKLALKKPSSAKQDKPKLIDLSLFKNFGFCAVCLQLFLFTLSFNTTFTFLPAFVKEKNIDTIYGAYLVSMLGICDCISRVVMSSLLDLKRIRPYRLILYNISLVVAGVISLLLPTMKSFLGFAFISCCYGIVSGLYISQKSVVCIDVLGVKHLTNSFGLMLAFQGAAAFIGPTIGGIVKDALGSYEMSFYIGSVGIFLGALTMAMGNVWMYRQKKKTSKEEQEV